MDLLNFSLCLPLKQRCLTEDHYPLLLLQIFRTQAPPLSFPPVGVEIFAALIEIAREFFLFLRLCFTTFQEFPPHIQNAFRP